MSIYSDDLSNRFPTYTFTENSVGTGTRVDADNGGPVLFAAFAQTTDQSYERLRNIMVGGAEILPELTTSQRDALTPATGTAIFNSDNIAIERYDGTNWVPTNQIIEGTYTFQGDTKFGGDASIAPVGRISVIGDDFGSGRIRTLIYSTVSGEGAAVQVGHSRGSESTPSALLAGDRLGQFIFVGDNGSAPASNGPYLRAFAAENWGGSAKGSNIEVRTIAPGTTSAILATNFSEYGYPEVPEYTVATLPNVGNGGGIIVVTDETGGYTQAFSDGTNWRRVQDRAIVS